MGVDGVVNLYKDELVSRGGCFYRRRKRKPRPEEQLPKGCLPGEKLSLAEALARIDPCHLAAFLANAPECPPGFVVFDLVDYFSSALTGVSSVEYQYPWPNMNNLRDVIDLPFRHVPEPVFEAAEDWIEKVELKEVTNFVLWSFCWIHDRVVGITAEPYSEGYYHLERSPEMLPFTVWMMAQVAQVDLWSGLHSWASNLLPLVRDKLKDNPRSINLILQLVEHVCLEPGALETILEDVDEDERLFPIPSFEILLPLTFPASFERVKVTKRFEAVYPLLKEVALADADAAGIEGLKKVTQMFDVSLKLAEQGNPVLAKEATAIAIWCVTKNTQDTERFEAFYPSLRKVALSDALGVEEMIQITPHIFASSFKFAAEENPVLAKEATAIAILCLTKNVYYCCNRWDKVCMDNPKASVALLKKLVDEWEDHSLKPSSSETRILNLTMKSFVVKAMEKVTLPKAFAKIDPSDLARSLAGSIPSSVEELISKLVDYFGRPLSRVILEYKYPWSEMKYLGQLIDFPFRHIPGPIYNIAADWIDKAEDKTLCNFVIWSFDWTRDRLAGETTDLHSEVSQVDLCTGLHSWAWNLLPLVCDKFKCHTRSMNLIMQLMKNVLSHRMSRDIFLTNAARPGVPRLFPITSFEMLLPLTFPASFERVNEDTERFQAVYPLLKEVALADAPGIEEMKQVTQFIFDFSLKFAEQGNADLAKEATSIAVWCVTKNVDCCDHWERVYMENPKASVALLKKLVDEWKDHSLKLTSSRRDTRVLNLTMKLFMLKNERGITGGGGAKCSIYKEADKYCKEISRRLSRGISFLKGCGAISVVVILVAVLLQWFYLTSMRVVSE
ncbi:unnamed protein product [Microthlaspi erraticum]|uniref:Uncharacterized protein n=1 Tax=Microthlaspi erraticum TaxID=1685480 RepID=A0A6D2HBL8_9BRAS|nr:unnamed protein product [Microthlaspi erraticum]